MAREAVTLDAPKLRRNARYTLAKLARRSSRACEWNRPKAFARVRARARAWVGTGAGACKRCESEAGKDSLWFIPFVFNFYDSDNGTFARRTGGNADTGDRLAIRRFTLIECFV